MLEEDDGYLNDLTLKKIEVRGFRGTDRVIEIDLKRDANFLIGRNGTGKTTLINLISDTLACRYSNMMSSPFEEIKITFQHSDNRYKPFLTAKKNYDEDGDLIEVIYEFTDFKTKGPSFSYPIKSRYYRQGEDMARSMTQRRIRNELSKRFKLTWLALNRSVGLNKPSSEKSNDLDDRLEHSLQRLGTYFTTLDSLFAQELQKFQQEWFMSLLVSSRRANVIQQVARLNIQEEDKQIREMLRGIGISDAQFSGKVDRHITTATKIAANGYRPPTDEVMGYIADLSDIARLHHWVEQWQELQDRKVAIYRPREKFLAIASSMLFRKRLDVDAGNRVFVRTGKAPTTTTKAKQKTVAQLRREAVAGRLTYIDEVALSDLSSGEKQLLIFLSETVLQLGEPHVFIADEPELSLHIEWQEKLVPVLLELNPKAQILFATHSPDIVNTYQNNVFSMEKVAY
ncbi:hypothetical protein PARHAE_03811 [Paracoccus haematequi]|uniref:Uncharacterized protein n=1 Tax=Paracoccus haematequi TaxID=2491866 RepID=A0A3S5D4B4_9RHOB|nr:AAA family ATPase [Paracoccus haematequi]VDS10595.1 hypothetical protein PARHAE_03811 [Paracoccus haematequi]